jgi:hypothetical protein
VNSNLLNDYRSSVGVGAVVALAGGELLFVLFCTNNTVAVVLQQELKSITPCLCDRDRLIAFNRGN